MFRFRSFRDFDFFKKLYSNLSPSIFNSFFFFPLLPFGQVSHITPPPLHFQNLIINYLKLLFLNIPLQMSFSTTILFLYCSLRNFSFIFLLTPRGILRGFRCLFISFSSSFFSSSISRLTIHFFFSLVPYFVVFIPVCFQVFLPASLWLLTAMYDSLIAVHQRHQGRHLSSRRSFNYSQLVGHDGSMEKDSVHSRFFSLFPRRSFLFALSFHSNRSIFFFEYSDYILNTFTFFQFSLKLIITF